MNLRLALVAVTATAILSACSTSERPMSRRDEGEVQSPASSLPARWWLWVESTGARNPVSDASGEHCGVNQPADVWFLAGTYGGTATRTCTIPSGRPVYFPVINRICEVVDGAVEEALDECDPDPADVSAELDGKQLTIVEATSEGAFTFTAGPDSVLANSGDQFEAVAGGAWVGPMTLPVGGHVLKFEATSADFELDVTYDLTVE